MTESPIQNVSDTAFMVAAYRALETASPQPLFRDPLASKLAGEHGKNIIASLPRNFLAGWTVSIRTVIIDNFVNETLARGVDTVLNLGAGLDTRPYRMALPKSLRWIEVDYPHVVEWKERCLAGEPSNCQVDRVKLDLSDREARTRLFAQIAEGAGQVLVLSEGVIPYLTPEEVGALADDLKAVDGFRFWIVDYLSRAALRFRRRQAYRRHLRNAPFRFDPDDWFGFFAGHGWEAKDCRFINDEAERLNRPMPLSPKLRLWVKLFGLLAPRRQKEAMKFAAYVLLEQS